jgi:hypothetical protein
MRPSAMAPGHLCLLCLSILLFSTLSGSSGAQARRLSRVQCYTSFDSDYFYVAATVQKPNLAGRQKDYFTDPLKDDSIAVFLQTEDQQPGQSRSPKSVSMAVSAAGGVQLYRGAAAKPLAGFADFLQNAEKRPVPFKAAAQIRGRLSSEGGDNTGYAVEMAIPWVELGGAPTVGQKMRFNVVAYSAAPGTAPVLSLAPGVKTAADVQNPSLWDEIVFVDAPVRTVASAPKAKVSARLFSVKPLIDGSLAEGEWNTLTGFGFAETATGAEPAAISVGASRVRPKVNLHKARPAIRPGNSDPPPAALAPRSPQPVPRLVFAFYNYDVQNDPRKAAPLKSVNSLDGASLLSSHPMEGSGPWFSYDRVDWHRKQLQDVRRGGIDVIVARYRGDVFSKQRYALRGLQTLTAALQSLDQSNQDYPLVALDLDLSSLSDAKGDKLDLTSAAGKATLYAAIRDFFLQIPASYRASVQLLPKNGGSLAYIAVLSGPDTLAGVDGSVLDYCRARYIAEFGHDLVVLGASALKGKATLDGYVDNSGAKAFNMVEGGWIKSASVGPGYDRTLQNAKESPLRPRDDGKTYASEWKQAIAKGADWVFIDGWNDYAEGTEVAPTLMNGIQYVDMTRLYTRELAGIAPFRAVYLNHSVPNTGLAGSTVAASVRVSNSGTSLWTPETVVAVVRWVMADGGPAGDSTTIPISAPILPGQALSLLVSTRVPAQPGQYALRVEMAQIRKKGDAPAGFGPESDALLASIKAAAPDSARPFGITVVSQDTSVTAEAGGSYQVRVTLRNDGSLPWKQQGGRITARVWRYTSPINSTGEAEQTEVIDMADAGAALPADVAPGQQVSLNVPINFSTEDGVPLASWSQADNWAYQLRWEYSADESGKQGAVSDPAPLALIDADLGAQFISDLTPPQLPGDRRVPVKIGLRNLGPQTWLKDKVRVGYHWYYLDGTEAVWQDETTPIAQDIEPGGSIPEMLAWVTAPPNDGSYYLVWDLKVGDSWGSTLPSVRPNETRVLPIEIVHGKLILTDLSKSYNLDGVTFATGATDGDFDGTGRTFPAELIPPFAMTDVAPSTMWLPAKSTGPESTRKVSFRWGPKGEKEKNFLQCLGQKVPLVESKKAEACSRVHILAASTGVDKLGEFTLVFSDGTQQLNSFLVSTWDGPPTHGEELSAFCRYSHTRSGPAFDKPVALHHYTVKVGDRKKVVAIILPNTPQIKIAAVTLEK